MQEDKAFKDLQFMFEELESSDVAPRWHKEAAWFRINEQLKQDRKRRLPIWIYPLAAAVIAICFLLFVPATDRDHTVVHVPASQLTPVVPIQKLVPASSNRAITLISAPKKEPQSSSTSVLPVAGTASVVVLQIPIPPVAGDSSPRIAMREPEVIYTITEIMADIHEQEAPPKRYSGFFNSSRGQMPPADNTSKRHRELSPVPEMPTLITN